MRNRKEIAVFGIKRSGNHPIIHWLLHHAGRCCVQLNDVRDVDPYGSCWNTFTRGLDPVRCRPRGPAAGKSYPAGAEINYRRDDDSVDWDYLRALSPKDWLMISYEEVLPDSSLRARYKERRAELVGSSAQHCQVVILRDAFNLFASLYRSPFGQRHFIERCVEVYKRYAELFLDKDRQRKFGVVCANYNRWVMSPEYRIELAAKLGISVDGRPHLHVPIAGGGSSFDRRSFDGRADQMKVFDRWRRFRHDPRYREIFADEQLLELSEAVFGDVSGGSRPP